MTAVAVGLFLLMLASAVAQVLIERYQVRWVSPRGRMAITGAGGVGLSSLLFIPDKDAVPACLAWGAGLPFGLIGLGLIGLAAVGRAERVARLATNSQGRFVSSKEAGPPPVRWPRRPPPVSPDDAFLDAIEAAPDDDTLRLVYADWLDERGDPRGEFVRAEVEANGGEPAAGERLGCLLGTTDPEWAARILRRTR